MSQMNDRPTARPYPIYKSPYFVYFVIFLLVSYLWMPGLVSVARRFLSTMATEYVSGTHSMAFVTVPNKEVGAKLAKGLLEKKLAACVNIIPGITSMYEWEGKIEEDAELLLMIKTRTSKVTELSTFVRENHPYDVAEVISSPIADGNPPYLKWLGEVVPDN